METNWEHVSNEFIPIRGANAGVLAVVQTAHGGVRRDTAVCQLMERSEHRADQDNGPHKGVGGLRAWPHPCSCDTERRFPSEEGDHRWSPRALPGVMYRLKVSS